MRSTLPTTPAKGRKVDNPYRGARWLGVDDTMFGRDDELAELESLLFSERIAVLIAASGVGKTSLLQAGLRKELSAYPPFVEGWLAGFKSHGPADVAAGRNRYEAAVLAALGVEDASSETLEEALNRLGDGGRILLVLDQFEELFTLDSTDWPAKRAFLAQLGRALEPSNRWAVIAIRQEFLADLETHASLFPGDLRARIHIQPFSPPQAMAAIIGPADKMAHVQVDELLAEDLTYMLSAIPVDTSDGEQEFKQGDTVEPIHLQLMCHQLWNEWREAHGHADRMTSLAVEQLDFIREAADLKKVFATYYNEQIDTAVAKHPEVSERVLRDWFGDHLIKNNRREQALPPAEPGAADAVEDLESRYLITRARSDRMFYELSHDRLIRAVKDGNQERFAELESLYEKSARWAENRYLPQDLETERSILETLQDIIDGHPRLVSEGERDFVTRSEARVEQLEEEAQRLEAEARKRRRLIALVTLVSLIAVVVVVFLFQESAKDERLRQVEERANAALLEAESDPGLALAMAVDAAANLEDGDEMPSSLFSVLYRLVAATPTQRVLQVDGAPRLATALATLPDQSRLVVGDADGNVVIYDADSQAELAELAGLNEPVTQVVTAADGSLIGARGRDGNAQFWRKEAGVWQPSAAGNSVRFIAIRPGSTTPVMLASDGRFLLEDGDEIELQTPPAAAIVLDENRTVVLPAEATEEALLYVVDRGGRQVGAIQMSASDGTQPTAAAPDGAVVRSATAAAWSPNGELIAVGTRDGTVAVATVAEGPVATVPGGAQSAVRSIVWLADGLMVSGGDAGLVLWSVTTTEAGAELAEIRSISHPSGNGVAGVGLTVQDNEVAVLTTAGTVEWWRAPRGHNEEITALAMLPSFVVTGDADGTLRRWDTSTFQSTQFQPRRQWPVAELVSSGSQVIAVWGDGWVKPFEEVEGGAENGEPIKAGTGCFLEVATPISAIAASDGTAVIATTAGDLEVRPSGICEPGTLVNLGRPIQAVEFTGDTDQIIAGLDDGSVVFLTVSELDRRGKQTPSSGVITAMHTDDDGDLYVGYRKGLLVDDAPRPHTGSQAGAVTDIAAEPASGIVITLSGERGTATVWPEVLGKAQAVVSLPSIVTALGARDEQLIAADGSGLVTWLPMDDGELELRAERASSWLPTTREQCGERKWLRACEDVEDDDIERFDAVKDVLATAAIGAPGEGEGTDGGQQSPIDVIPQVGRALSLFESYSEAVEAGDTSRLRELVVDFSEMTVSDLAAEIQGIDGIEWKQVHLVADGQTAQIDVAVVETRIAEDGTLLRIGACQTWTADFEQGDAGVLKRGPEQEVAEDNVDELVEICSS